MSLTGESSSFARSVRRLPSRTPLRVKLITAVLGLVAVALVVISVAGLGFLKNYLLNQADATLSNLVNQSPGPVAVVRHDLFSGQTGLSNGQPVAIDWLPARGQVQAVYQETTGYGVNSSGAPTPGPAKPGPKVVPGAAWLSNGSVTTVGATSGAGRFRVVAIPDQTVALPNGQLVNGTVIVGVDVSDAYQTLGKLTGIDIIVSAILLLGLAVIGVAVIRTSLRPLTDIEQTAEAIAAGDLTRRVPDRDPHTEIGRLGRSLNTMLAQIETAFHARSASELAARRSEDRMRQFVADASHELRTPLTAIRGFAEYYRQRGGVALPGPGEPGEAGEVQGVPGGRPTGLAPADLDRIMRRVEQESSRMGVLVEDMLLLARLDQQRPLEHRTVDLLTLAADAVHDARVVAPDRSIHLTVGAGAALLVLGDEVRLRQVIGNLMSNALSHTPDGTPIDVRIRSGRLDEVHAPGTAQPALPSPAPGPSASPAAGPAAPAPPAAPVRPAAPGRPRSAAVLEVTDHGPGLTREQAEHAFERFYRADQARTTGGTGLGLAIVAALVAAHGGSVWVESVPGAGATFRIALPLAPEALHDAEQDDAEQDDAGDPGDADIPGEPGPASRPGSGSAGYDKSLSG